jgi:hypothetical protein
MVTNKNAMTLGVEVLNWTPQPEKYLNDNIHPCVRYIPEGFAGHKWWMVTTPYPGGDALVENPILYWGDSRDGELPPLTWNGGVVVFDTPSSGYNSDPNLYFDGTKLWVFWRENATPDTAQTGGRATFGKSTTDGVNFSEKKLIAPLGFDIPGKSGDAEMCPCVVNFDGTLKLFGSYYEFTPIRRPYGLAIWDILNNDLDNNQFTLTKTVGQLYKEEFNFWHFDLFKEGTNYYCVATPERGNEILLGISTDSENFKFWSMPLLSNSVAGTVYLYKPSAMVHQGILYVWHPNKINGTSRIFMTEKPFSEVISALNSSISKIS